MVAVIKALEELPQAVDSEPLRSDARYLAFHCSVGTRFWGICQRVLGLSREFLGKQQGWTVAIFCYI